MRLRRAVLEALHLNPRVACRMQTPTRSSTSAAATKCHTVYDLLEPVHNLSEIPITTQIGKTREERKALDQLMEREFDITMRRKVTLFKNQPLNDLDHDLYGFISS